MANQPNSIDGSVVATTLTLPAGVTPEQLRVRAGGQVQYLRGLFEKHNWGELLSVDRLMLERCDDTNCTLKPVEQTIYQASDNQVDWHGISDQLDPDGEEADSCVYVGLVDGVHTFEDTNSWCETRFTKEGVVVLISPMRPIALTGNSSSTGRISVESDQPPARGAGISIIQGEADVPVSFTDYESSEDTTFTAKVATLFTAPGPFTVSEANQHGLGIEKADSETTTTLVREQREMFQSYPGFPKVGYSLRVRTSDMTASVTAGENPNQVNLILEPTYWDSALPLCSEPDYAPGEYCNAGYRGDLAITVTDQRGRVIFDNRVSLTPIVDL